MPEWITIPIAPCSKGRPRVTKTGIAYTPEKTRRWESDFRAMTVEHWSTQTITGPVRVDIIAVLPRPKRLMRQRDPDGLIWAPTRPDADNIRKAVLDALDAWWVDDSQVCAGDTWKVYAEKGGAPRIMFRVEQLDDAGVPEVSQ